jgi:hypothetical protein
VWPSALNSLTKAESAGLPVAGCGWNAVEVVGKLY